uniref:Uncharacterized protein n=1 Tax=Setaria viridis TaxID=4556 RepID=A0A4U6VYC2_SETVI|nr:hypothetical protein SEVIR_2G269550v2 [Setaria viridis]TKW33901.1 hypothetical protein SEVIR_2G269550v2 [Setaria viridis]TKW33903.1 hypothetical protein SEVIR_2G269550v2 [Setaria viridis]
MATHWTSSHLQSVARCYVDLILDAVASLSSRPATNDPSPSLLLPQTKVFPIVALPSSSCSSAKFGHLPPSPFDSSQPRRLLDDTHPFCPFPGSLPRQATLSTIR